jgi:hypothetical protein
LIRIADRIGSSTPPRSERKLSQVAKRLAYPSAQIVRSDWAEIRDTCRDDMGITFDGWQDGMGTLLLARNDRNKLVHTVGGFGLSAMRQIGKTYFFAGAFFGMCQKYPGLLVIWSAHHSKTHNETFEAMQGFAARTSVKPFIKKVYTGSGDEAIVFHNGSRILFGARERGFGRGIPGVDVLMSDEGQIMSERAMQNMLATLNTSDIGLHIYAGTPPKPEDNAEAWMRMRGEAWVIEDPEIVTVETEDMVWIEIGADDNADPSDPYQWAKNPSFPHRTPVEAFLRLRRKLNAEGWLREGLGIYDKDEGSAFDIAKWNTLAVEDADEPDRAALVLDVSPDQRWASLGIASTLPADSLNEDERTLVMVKEFRGTRGVVKAIREMDAEKDLVDIAITPGAARALEDELTRANFEWHQMTAGEMAAAYGTLKKAIRDSMVAHLDQPELNFALINVKKRFLQTGEAEAFDRREVDGEPAPDVSPAVATAAAMYRWGLCDEPMPFIG